MIAAVCNPIPLLCQIAAQNQSSARPKQNSRRAKQSSKNFLEVHISQADFCFFETNLGFLVEALQFAAKLSHKHTLEKLAGSSPIMV